MKIVIDTNVIHKDFFLQNAQIINLCETAKKCGIKVFIPQVVIDEVINHYREKIEDARSNFEKAKGGLSFFYPNENIEDYFTVEKTAQLLEDYKIDLDKRLSELDIQIIPYPDISHEKLVKRDLARKKPFQQSGKGYRDALIWESVHNIIENNDNEPDLVFINKNTKDFFDKERLHPDLQEDIANRGFSLKCIEIYDDISKVIDQYIKPRQESLNGLIKLYVGKDAIGEIDINSFVKDKAMTYLRDGIATKIPFFQTGIGSHLENPFFYDCSKSSCEIKDIRLLNDDQIIIYVEGILSTLYGGLLHKTTAYVIGKKNLPQILDTEWDENYMMVQDNLNLPITLSIIVDKDLKTIHFYNITVE